VGTVFNRILFLNIIFISDTLVLLAALIIRAA